jgi:tRNA threonylcarbamoyl adenosine modification protein YeaZ
VGNNPIKSNSLVLAIETSGRIGSVSIARENSLLAESSFSGFMKHSSELFTRSQQLLDQVHATPDQISDIYITAGPGSFTGLRIAVTAAKMFAFAQNAHIVAADTMDVMVQNVTDCIKETNQEINCACTILDAKRNLFYAAVFDRHGDNWNKVLGTELMSADDILAWLSENKKHNVAFLGEGLVYYADKFKRPFSVILEDKYWTATASGLFTAGRKMAEKGQFADPMTLTPYYIRIPEAEENWHRRQSQ